MIVTERGLNKALVPVRRMKGKEIKFPFTWVEQRDGEQFESSISNYWDTSNFMVMDVLTNCYKTLNRDKIAKREPVITNLVTGEHVNPKPIVFTTEDFRKITGQTRLYRKEITTLILETSKIGFKIVYPVLYLEDITKGRNKGRQRVKQRYLSFGEVYTIFKVELDGDRFLVTFDPILGKFFCHNIQLKGFNQLPDNFYNLPKPAQLVYRKFFSHIFNPHPIKLHIDEISTLLNLETKDEGMLKYNIVKNILEPLKGNEPPLISSYEYHNLFNERFYNIKI
jgi:hypothetical protein